MNQEHVFSSNYPDIDLPKGNFIKNLFIDLPKWEHLPALVCGKSLREITYKELQWQVYKWCGYFSSKHSKQTIIAMIAPNCLESCICLMGMIAAGMIYMGLDEISAMDDIVSKMKSLNIRDVIIHESHREKMAIAINKAGGVFNRIYIGTGIYEDVVTFSDVIQDETIKPLKEVKIDDENAICIVYTSGTTGIPKPMKISHRSFNANLEILSLPMWNPCNLTTSCYQAVSYAHRFLTHTYGMFLILFCGLRLGHKMIVKNYEDEKILDELEFFKITRLHIGPVMIKTLLKIPSEKPAILNHLKTVMSSGAPLPEAMLAEFHDKLNDVYFQNCYGMSECLIPAIYPVENWKSETVGRIVNNVKIKIVDMETGKSLPRYSKGEVLIKTPSLFTEYIHNPEATRKATVDGWLYSGDIGMVDCDNNIILFDRIKQIIKQGLLRAVYPAVVENVLLQHAGVADVCVIGVPHSEQMEAPRAYVVLRDPSVKTEDLNKLVTDKLPSHNQLKGGVIYLDALPMTPSGKVARTELKKIGI